MPRPLRLPCAGQIDPGAVGIVAGDQTGTMMKPIDLSSQTSQGCAIPGVSWDCPFCKRAVSGTARDYVQAYRSERGHDLQLGVRFLECPHFACKQVAILARLEIAKPVDLLGAALVGRRDGAMQPVGLPEEIWIRPSMPDIKEFPEYIPAAIRQDYEEACKILTLSPTASATLSRRCLQGMIRDFHGETKDRLIDEINAIEDKVDPLTWEAIDALRQIANIGAHGNIGAHMEKDVNLIIDVEPNEAQALIGLNEMLFKEWYIHRKERQKNLQTIIDIGKNKQVAKKGGQAQKPPGGTQAKS